MDADLLASLSADPDTATAQFMRYVREDWLASLDPTTRERADRLIQVLRDAGDANAELTAYSEITDDRPQLARYLFLRNLWPRLIDPLRDQPSWIDASIESAKKQPIGFFADAGMALHRMLEAGVNRQDIGKVARMVAYEVVFGVLATIDEGYAEDIEEPGWALTEMDARGETTGRYLSSLHEGILSMDPSSREGKPDEKTVAEDRK